MSLASLLSQLRRSYTVDTVASILKLKSLTVPAEAAAETIVVDRPLTEQEYAIAEWLLLHSTPPATDFLPQLAVARVSGHCSCGCPTADLKVPEDAPKAVVRDNPIGDAIGEVNGQLVGIMLLQRGGYLICLEIYDLSDIEHPYGLPELNSLRLF